MSIELTCPGCRRVFQLESDRAGERFRCSACGETMSVPTPGTDMADDFVLLPDDDRDDRTPASERPANHREDDRTSDAAEFFFSKSSATTDIPVARSRKVATVPGTTPPRRKWFMIFGCLGVLFLLVALPLGIAGFVKWQNRPGTAQLDPSYIPEDAVFAVVMHVNRLSRSPLYREGDNLGDLFPPNLFDEPGDLNPDHLDSVAIVMLAPPEKFVDAADPTTPAPPDLGTPDDPRWGNELITETLGFRFRFRNRLNLKAQVQSDGHRILREFEFRGHKTIEVAPRDEFTRPVFFLKLDRKTMLVGTEAVVGRMLDAGRLPIGPIPDQLRQVRRDVDLAVAISPEAWDESAIRLAVLLDNPFLNDPGLDALRITLEDVATAVFTLDFSAEAGDPLARFEATLRNPERTEPARGVLEHVVTWRDERLLDLGNADDPASEETRSLLESLRIDETETGIEAEMISPDLETAAPRLRPMIGRLW